MEEVGVKRRHQGSEGPKNSSKNDGNMSSSNNCTVKILAIVAKIKQQSAVSCIAGAAEASGCDKSPGREPSRLRQRTILLNLDNEILFTPLIFLG